jgi:alpha-2-macroglobulin
VKWVLTAKNEDHWSSTKATSAAIRMLYKENKTVVGATQIVSSDIHSRELSVTDDLLHGNAFDFIRDDRLSPVELKKQNTFPAMGNVIWYYFTSPDSLNKLNKEVSLKKELFRYNNTTASWEPVNEKTTLKIADKIRVVLTVETSKALYYTYIDDKRAAAFESQEIHSGYQYTQGLSYYLSVRDASSEFFSEFIPSGRTTISYEMVVAHEGSFINGPTTLQCMYRPEITAYSNSLKLQTIK